MCELAKKSRPTDKIMQCLFEHFKSPITEKADVLNFIMTMCVVARIKNEKKIEILFQLCDDNDDN